MSFEANSLPYSTNTFPAVSLEAYQKATEIYDSYRYTSEFLESYGFEPREILHDWYNSYGQPRLPSYRFLPSWPTTAQYPVINIASMLDLEQTHPGGVKELSVYNGLRNFARAPQPLLHYLCDNRTMPASRVVLLASGFESVGEAGLENMVSKYGQLIGKLPRDTALSYIEIGRARDLTDLGTARVRDHGQHARLHVATLSFHGHPTGGTLRNARLSSLDTRQYDFESAEIRYLDTLLHDSAIPEATIVMSACKTGRGRNNIARRIHRTTGHKVIAPTDDIYVSTFSIVENDDMVLVPKVRYRRLREHPTHDKWVSYPSKPKRYPNRRKNS